MRVIAGLQCHRCNVSCIVAGKMRSESNLAGMISCDYMFCFLTYLGAERSWLVALNKESQHRVLSCVPSFECIVSGLRHRRKLRESTTKICKIKLHLSHLGWLESHAWSPDGLECTHSIVVSEKLCIAKFWGTHGSPLKWGVSYSCNLTPNGGAFVANLGSI